MKGEKDHEKIFANSIVNNLDYWNNAYGYVCDGNLERVNR